MIINSWLDYVVALTIILTTWIFLVKILEGRNDE